MMHTSFARGEMSRDESSEALGRFRGGTVEDSIG